MLLGDIHKAWETDSFVDKTKLDEESLAIPTIHSKYLRWYSTEKQTKLKIENDIKELEHILWQFYSKQLTMTELKEYGLEYPDKTIIKTDVSRWVNSNSDMIMMKTKLGIQLDKIEILSNILQMLSSRSFHINSAIKYMTYTAGGY